MGFSRDELESFRGGAVPDLAGDDVRLVFVGINPGLWTAATGAHFAHPANRFYRALHLAGVCDEVIDASEGYDERSVALLTGKGIAITNLVNRATARASELTAGELREGSAEVERKVAEWEPRVVAVVGVTAYRTAFARPDATVGRQEETLGGAELWVLPNPSGLNAHYQVDDLARLYRASAEAAGLALSPPRT
ncbi:MAG TPA: mismatch-specific DNA-glycosylase [Nitriliruptorales bacterium]|nr:mismatch-specific DNA-glycosylase [Nitriliruptorales bacterium]